jgi:drug/metabolite transporter (DMT)-like permease
MTTGETSERAMKSAGLAAAVGALTAAFFFGVSTPLSKALLSDLNPFLLAGLLYLGAGLGLAPLELLRKKKPAPAESKRNYKYIAGMVLFGGLLGPVLLLLGIKIAPAASVSIWLNMELVATALLGYFLFKDHLHRLGWASVALTLAAGLLLSWGGGAAGFKAGLLVALACFAWGLDNHFTALIDDLSPSQSTIIKGLAAGTTNLAIGLALNGGLPPLPVVFKALLVGFHCYGLSITLYISAAQRLGAVRSQLVFSVAPLFGVLVSVLWLGEGLTAVQAVSGVLLFGSVLLMLSEKHAHRHAHPETEHTHQHAHDDQHHGHPHDAPAGEHAHFHRHEPGEHKHPHWPDLHHRHTH